MKIEYQIDILDALVIIDPTMFPKLDEEFLNALDIFLDSNGESELVYDFPGEDWNDVWNRETKCVRDFIVAHNMIIWPVAEGDYEGEIVETEDEMADEQELTVSGSNVVLVTASELIQSLLYPEIDMEVIAEIALEKGTYYFEKSGSDIRYKN